jgi:hypothetical protein
MGHLRGKIRAELGKPTSDPVGDGEIPVAPGKAKLITF